MSPDKFPVESRAVLRHIESLGYRVSIFSLRGSLLGTVPPTLELHAVKPGEPPEIHVVKADPDDMARAVGQLAESVGIEF